MNKSSECVLVAAGSAGEVFDMNTETTHATLTTTSHIARHPQQSQLYAELQEQVHDALRAQHPEWIDSEGDSPICDWYDLKLAELIRRLESGAKQP
jgi:hypothetical protein